MPSWSKLGFKSKSRFLLQENCHLLREVFNADIALHLSKTQKHCIKYNTSGKKMDAGVLQSFIYLFISKHLSGKCDCERTTRRQKQKIVAAFRKLMF